MTEMAWPTKKEYSPNVESIVRGLTSEAAFYLDPVETEIQRRQELIRVGIEYLSYNPDPKEF